MTRREHRAGCEFRLAGRSLNGTVLRYGDISPQHRERFEAGAFAPLPAVPMRLQHDPEMQILAPGGFVLNDTDHALEVRAELPADSAALRLVQRGVLGGWSVGFHALSERRESGIRVVSRASLLEISLVDAPSYPASTAEARARSGRRLRSSIPFDRDLACECIAREGTGSGGACVPIARMAKVAGEAMQEAIGRAFDEAQRGVLGPDVLAVHKDYSRPLGSARRGTLRAVEADDGLGVEVDLPTGAAGDAIVDATEAAGVIVRPLIDEARSEFTDGPDGRTYTRPHLRAVLIGSTDSRAGWPDARIDYEGDGERAVPVARRRLWL